MWIQKTLKRCILPIQCQQILRQIIGTDGKELTLCGELLRTECRRRCLNHNSDLRLNRTHTLSLQLLPAGLKHALRLTQLRRGDDHRKHHRQPAVDRGAKQCAELSPKQLPVPETEAYRATAQRRIVLLLCGKIGELLVCADIAGADHNSPSPHCIQHLAIGRELLLL